MHTSDHVFRDGLLQARSDWAQLAAQFAATGRVQIDHALHPELALHLRQCLLEQVPWDLAFHGPHGSKRLSAAELSQLSPAARMQLEQEIRVAANVGFGFRYLSYMMIPAYLEQRDPQLLLHPLVEQLNAPGWLQPIQRLIGEPTVSKADAQATCYLPGDFLNVHNDYHAEDRRLAAYVINLSQDWLTDWGGLLQFVDKAGRVVDEFAPRFNSLSVFRVPTLHRVSPVAAVAVTGRYAITGWIRAA